MLARLTTALLALAAAHVSAVEITSPAKNSAVDASAGVTVKWTTVSTDPATAHLYLVNMAAGHTPFRKDLGAIDLSKGSVVVSAADVPADGGYQFNFERSDDNGNTGILAQSQQFDVKPAAEGDKSSSASASASATGQTTATTTATVSDVTTGPTASQTTLTTTASSASVTGSATSSGSAATSSTSTGAAAPTGMTVQGGSLLVALAGVAAVLA